MQRIIKPESEPHQRSMLRACAHGRLTELQELFRAHNVHEGDAAVHFMKVPANGPPDTISMFAVAIENNQLAIIQYLLSVYPAVKLDDPRIAEAIIESKQLDVFQLIAQQSPGIYDYEDDGSMRTLLTSLCSEGPSAWPLINFMLDHGAYVNGGCAAFSSLHTAIHYELPVNILRKMINLGASWGLCTIKSAIELKKFDAARLMLDLWQGEVTDRDENGLREALEGCENKEIIELTNSFIEKKYGERNSFNLKIARSYEWLTRIRMPQFIWSRKTGMEQVNWRKLQKMKTDEDND